MPEDIKQAFLESDLGVMLRERIANDPDIPNALLEPQDFIDPPFEVQCSQCQKEFFTEQYVI